MIYFDNAATTYQKPIEVYRDLINAVFLYGGNPGRSSHALSIMASQKVYDVREKVASFCHFDKPEKVVFTENATYALNMAIKSSINSFCHVLISDIEHNAVYRPIEKQRSFGRIEYDIFHVKDDVEGEIIKKIRPKTKFIICNLASNISGYSIPISILSDIRQRYGISIIADASQLVGHEDINLQKSPIDILCAPSHKGLFGIQGSGFAIFCGDIYPESWVEGGSGNDSKNPNMPRDLPERMEGGTLPTPAILSLGAGIDFINRIGMSRIDRRLKDLTDYAKKSLLSVENLHVLFPVGNGIVSFLFPPFSPEEIAEYLSENGIYVRAGFHCAPLAHQKIGTCDTGAVRVSFSYFNTFDEIDQLVFVLRKIKSK